MSFCACQVYRPTERCFREVICTEAFSSPSGFTNRQCRPRPGQRPCNESFSHYERVYDEPFNVTSGYNLIVLENAPRKFIAKPGDVIGFQADGATAPAQCAPPDEDDRVYFTANSARNLTINTTQLLNGSYLLSAHGSVPGRTTASLPGFSYPGIYILDLQFGNEASALPAIRPVVVVQNPIPQVYYRKTYYIALNTDGLITAEVPSGTNITCHWQIRNLSFSLKEHELGSGFEGGNCTMSTNFTTRGNAEVSLVVFNKVSMQRLKITADVRQPIAGLDAFLSLAEFAYQNGFTMMSATITHGDAVNLVWEFTRSNQSVKRLTGLTGYAGHPYTSLGKQRVWVSANNTVSFAKVNFSFRVIPNPLTVHAPEVVATKRQVEVVCTLTWPGGSSDAFFRQENVTGQKGTNVTAVQNFVLRIGSTSKKKKVNLSGRNASSRFFHTFR